MAFNGVKERTSELFNEVHIYLTCISRMEPDDLSLPIPLEVNIMKGLFYVHLYAAFEKSINDVIQVALSLISSHQVKVNHFSPPLLSIVMANDIQSLRDVSSSKVFTKSANLFITVTSDDIVSLNETIFTGHLKNIWMKTIDEVILSLGMSPLEFEMIERAVVDEVVDRRNAVAHGGDSASNVGERFRSDVLRRKMETISAIMNQIIVSIETHCTSKNFIKSDAKHHY